MGDILGGFLNVEFAVDVCLDFGGGLLFKEFCQSVVQVNRNTARMLRRRRYDQFLEDRFRCPSKIFLLFAPDVY